VRSLWRRPERVEGLLSARSVKLLLVGGVSACAALGCVRIFREGTTDFDGFHRAFVVVAQEGRLSMDKAVRRYPPTFQALLAPLGLFPLPVAGVIWQLLNVLAVLGLPRALARLSGVPPARQWPAWLLALPFMLDNLVLAQNGPLLLFLVTAGLALARSGTSVAGGALVGLAALQKVLPICFLGVPLFLKRVRGTMMALALTGLFAAALLTVAVGPAQALDGVGQWWHELRATNSPWAMVEAGRSLRYNNQALAVTIARTLCRVDPRAAKGAVRIASFPLAVGWVIYGLIAAAAALAWLAAAWRCRTRDGSRAWLGMYALSTPLMLVASPVVWTHYFVWLLPTALFLRDRVRLLLILAGASMIALGLRPARGLGFHMMLSLVLFALCAWEIMRPGGETPMRDRPADPSRGE